MLSRFGCINLGVCNLLKNILFASIRPVHARCQCQGHGLRSSVWSEGVGRVAVYTIARLLLDKRIDKFFCSSPTSGYTTFYMKFEVGKKMRIFFFATIMIGYSVNSATPPFFFLYRGLEAWMPAGYDGEKFSTHSKDFNCLKFAIEALCSREKRFFTDDAMDDLGEWNLECKSFYR